MHHRASGRIGAVARGLQTTPSTLKTPAQTAWTRSACSSALVAVPDSSTGFRSRRGHRRPLSTITSNGTESERVSRVRYTSHLAFRLRRWRRQTGCFPQVWKDLLRNHHTRRSEAIKPRPPDNTPECGYAPEQVFRTEAPSGGLWIAESAAGLPALMKGKRETVLR